MQSGARRMPTEKAKIAKAALSLVEEGDTISLDASTTVLRLCQEMHHINRLTVLTNSIQVLLEFAGRPGLNVIGTGGTLRETALSFVGPLGRADDGRAPCRQGVYFLQGA